MLLTHRPLHKFQTLTTLLRRVIEQLVDIFADKTILFIEEWLNYSILLSYENNEHACNIPKERSNVPLGMF